MISAGRLARVTAVCAAAVTLGCGLLAGCATGGPASSGPLSDGHTGGFEQCSPVRPGGVLTYGFSMWYNLGQKVAVVDRVSLYRSHDLRLLAAYAVPATGTNLWGASAGTPSAASAPPGVLWSQRQNADGSRIPPRRRYKPTTNLLLVLRPVGTLGTAFGIDTYYRESGHRYRLFTNFPMAVAVRSCSGKAYNAFNRQVQAMWNRG